MFSIHAKIINPESTLTGLTFTVRRDTEEEALDHVRSLLQVLGYIRSNQYELEVQLTTEDFEVA